MEIRRATDGDTAQILNLLVQVCNVHAEGRPDLFKKGSTKYTPNELRDIIHDEGRPIFVATEGETVLGYAFCVINEPTNNMPVRSLYIDDLCVDEAARGHHVGKSLYEYVLSYARSGGFYNVTLNVWSCNPKAMGFYEAMGLKVQKIGMEVIL